MINESFNFEAMDTPGKKRKRDNAYKFTSSTPIKVSNKENNLFSDTLCMEVKSIADLVSERRQKKMLPPSEYEVIRKPPKKKKKTLSEESCFVNSALDLKNNEEKIINPFEIIRDDCTEAKSFAKGVSNPALDVKSEPIKKLPTKPTLNPFEVARQNVGLKTNGIDNVACDLNAQEFSHSALVLPLPFTPTVNHRIDFSSMPNNLTPSTLLTSKLVLENNEAKISVISPKRNTSKLLKSLSVISEENDLDIGEELDNYQLQLENSINEAKIQKNQNDTKIIHDRNSSLSQDKKETFQNTTYTKEIVNILDVAELPSPLAKPNQEEVKDDFFSDSNDGIQFEEVDSFEDIQKLGQFKRAYRKEKIVVITKSSTLMTKSGEPNEAKKSHTIAKSIRSSIRKLMHPNNLFVEKNKIDEQIEKNEGSIFQTIRHSLRRKQKPKIPQQVSLETSIIGRQVFRETSNEDAAQPLEKKGLKRNVIKKMKTFMESVEEFEHY